VGQIEAKGHEAGTRNGENEIKEIKIRESKLRKE